MRRFVLIVCVLAITSTVATGTAEDQPNVIIILADDLGYGDLSCYPMSPFSTPQIDRMAAEGARWTDFYVPVPYCAPTRASLMTGRYPLRCGLPRNPFPGEDLGGIRNADDIGLPPEEITIAESLKAAGYRTACIGKWHLGHQPRFFPTRQGFDYYYGILYSNDMHPVRLYENEEVIEYPVVQATLTQRYTERAIRFIENNHSRPFFLYLAHAMPHKPLACSENFYQRTGKGLYADVLAELDWSVGKILATLRRLGIEKKTLVIFTSDNGPWYGGSTGGLRGMKGSGCEGGIRVPLIVWWPGHVPAGQTRREPAIIMDLFPTVLAACRVTAPENRVIDGVNLLPVMVGESRLPERSLYFFRGERLIAVRRGPWKLHLQAVPEGQLRAAPPDRPYRDPRGPDGVRILAPCEQYHPSHHPGLQSGGPIPALALFNVAEDPGEQQNCSAEHGDIVDRLRQDAEQFAKELRGAR